MDQNKCLKKIIQSSGFSLRRAEKHACSLEEDEETNALLIALLKSLIVSFPEGIRHPSGLLKAVCCGEQWTVLIPEHEAFHVQYFPSSVTTCSLSVFALLPFVQCPGQARLASFNTCNPLDHL